MAELGWERLHVTVVQVAPIAPVLAGAPAGGEIRTVVEPTPSGDWRSLMHDLDADDPESHLAILTGPPRVGFATLHRREEGREDRYVDERHATGSSASS